MIKMICKIVKVGGLSGQRITVKRFKLFKRNKHNYLMKRESNTLKTSSVTVLDTCFEILTNDKQMRDDIYSEVRNPDGFFSQGKMFTLHNKEIICELSIKAGEVVLVNQINTNQLDEMFKELNEDN